MLIRVPAKDLALLRELQRGLDEGLTQTEIAHRVGLRSAGALQGRLHATGFRFVTEVRPILGGPCLSDALRTGQITDVEGATASDEAVETADSAA